MENFHILQISVIPMDANANPPRIRIKSQLFKQSIIIPWSNEPGNIDYCTLVAERYLKTKGFDIIGKAEGNADYDYIITNTFEPLKPFK